MISCRLCRIPTTNPAFCSRRCATIYNNKKFPKRRKKPRYCKRCNILISGRRTVCDTCNPSYVDWTKVTYQEISGKRKYQKNSRIRSLARQIYYHAKLPRKCYVCGYDKHIEVCHVKPIKKFKLTTPITDINALTNLVALCPNHHWEYDNQQLILDFTY